MKKEQIYIPDENAVARVLLQNQNTAAELILRLAWDAGLSRDEICGLKWENISFQQKQILLSDRSIPIDGMLLHCLCLRQDMYGNDSAYVVTSDRLRKPMQPESVSRIARLAMDTEPALENIRLIDLRHGFILRQLRENDWQQVARISGISVRTMQALFLPDASERRTTQSTAAPAACDAEDIQRAITATESTTIALALRLIWNMGLQARECVALTWDQVCWAKSALLLPDREVRIPPETLQAFQTLYDLCQPNADDHVLLTPKAHVPYTLSGLSKEIRTALIRSGVDATLQDLLRCRRQTGDDDRILQFAREKVHLTRQDIIRTFQLTAAQASQRLQRLVANGDLVRIGTTYYLAGKVVAPSQQYQVICSHLQAVGTAYRKELADLLGIGVRQCGWILHKWVQEGKLTTRGQLYTLPDPAPEEGPPDS